jgi:hypothetical protein
MLAPIIAAIIIILLIIYAAYPFLSNKDFHGWANIVLTALILFTVIITLFVILGNRKGDKISFKTIPQIQEETRTKETEEPQPSVVKQEPSKTPEDDLENITEEEALMVITKEYVQAEEAFKAQGDSDYQQKAAQQIIDRYKFTPEEWQSFLEEAARYDLFNKAKEEMKK